MLSLEIPLTRGKVALVDRDDFERLSAFSWCADNSGPGRRHWYAARGVNRGKAQSTQRILMHREIMQPGDGFVVDHIDGNGLNNRRANLRVCTQAENCRNRRHQKNRSGLRGVHPTRTGRYQVFIRFNRKLIGLGTFSDPIEAARAYDKAALQYFGEFATLNFPEGIAA